MSKLDLDLDDLKSLRKLVRKRIKKVRRRGGDRKHSKLERWDGISHQIKTAIDGKKAEAVADEATAEAKPPGETAAPKAKKA